MVETHYTNYNAIEGETDASSIEIYATSVLREHNAGVTMLGPITGELEYGGPLGIKKWVPIIIPPQESAFTITSDCLFPETTRVFATRAHGHLHMTSGYVEHLPSVLKEKSDAWQEARSFGVVNQFDYNYQPAKFVEGGGLIIEQGDLVRAHCIYNTEDSDSLIIGGPATTQEMCIHYLFHYPSRYSTKLFFDHKEIGYEKIS